MKKLYSLVAVMAITASIQAQLSENFDTQPNTPSTAYTAVNFSGADSTTWDLASVRIVNTAANYNISGTTALLNANGTVTITFPNGVDTLNFQYMKAFTGGTARSIQVSVDGKIVNTTATFGSGNGAQSMVYNYSYTINKSSRTIVEVKSLNAQTSVDNFSWSKPTLAVVEADSKVAGFIKNTVVDNAIIFGDNADVKIYSMNGQLLKSATVKSGQSLDVSSLSKGIYIVSGDIAGQQISKKIIKK